MSELTEKQQRFVEEYLVDLNATQAAIRAGYSEKTANAQAGRLLVNVSIQNAIAQAKITRQTRVNKQRKLEGKLPYDANSILNRLIEIDQLDVLDILHDDGALLPIKDWPKSWRTSLSSIDITEISTGSGALGAIKRVRWPDKLKNLELLGKHVQVKAFSDAPSDKSDIAPIDSIKIIIEDASADQS